MRIRMRRKHVWHWLPRIAYCLGHLADPLRRQPPPKLARALSEDGLGAEGILSMARRKVWGSVGCLVLMLILVCLHCETIAADAVTSDKPQAEMKLRLSAPTALWPTPPRPIRLRLAALGKQPKDT